MRQRITLPDKVTHSIFSLPCVICFWKSKKHAYGIIAEFGKDKEPDDAYPGDTLIEDDNGIWHLERRRV